jgi:exopolyphosphatase / guanosine-5'-triphosphate,3'-diphosphate pyrophosphatase
MNFMICGIVDLGSNTIRLSIYKYENSQTKLLLSKKSVAGLLGYVTNGTLGEKGIGKACSVLNNFKDIILNFGIEKAYVFATASLRNITNTAEALAAIKADTGYDVELLSGEDEAALDFYGAIHAADIQSGLLVDIGGGSTELVCFENRVFSDAVSIPVGSLNLSLKHVSSIIPDEAAYKKIKQDVLSEITKLNDFEAANQKIICGVGGTVRAARKIYNDMYNLSSDNMLMDCDKLTKVLSVYKKDPNEVMRRVMQLAPDRIHTVITGMIVLTTIASQFKVKKIIVSTCGVREGYLYQKVIGGELS